MGKKIKKEQSIEELEARLCEIDSEVFELRNELATQKKLEKPHLIKTKKREKARILTFLTQKRSGKGAV